MWQCHYCRITLSADVWRKNRLCPNCNSDLHACKNCTHYDEKLTSRCHEPESPWVADRDKQNSCTYFEFADRRHMTPTEEASNEAERAKEAFRALFRNV